VDDPPEAWSSASIESSRALTDRLVEIQSAAADAVLLAILDAVLSTTGITRRHPRGVSVPCYLDLYPSADPLDQA
jgi:hypothetical protein